MSETPSECPSEAELVPLAYGEVPGEALAKHLEQCAACRARLEALGRDVRSVRAMATSLDEAPVPEFVGRYKVVEQIGRGGQARVFRGVHPTLRNDVVIKLADHAVAEGSLDQSRLAAEARALCELNHPGIARVYDLGEQAGRPFIAMEYVPGRTLAQVAKEKDLSPLEAAGILAKVARALGAAHRLGITHRDVTPRNILLDASGTPRLIDFGLAFFRRANAGVSTQTFEPPGSVSGTPAFMAPEQLEGRNSEIGPRTDIYAAGEVLRYLLTARQPQRVIPARLGRIIDKATAKKPGGRYGSADEMAADLERFGAARRVAGLPPMAWAAVAAVVIALLVLPRLFHPTPSVTGGGGEAHPAAPAHLTRAQVLARARPAVFKVIAFGDLYAVIPLYAAAETNRGDLSQGWRGDLQMGYRSVWSSDVSPKSDGPTFVENEYQREVQAGTVANYGSKLDYCYRRVMADPTRYLRCQYRFRQHEGPPFGITPVDPAEKQAVAGIPLSINLKWFHAVPFAEGSAFAVSREGILLTNAHVVGKPTSVPDAALIEPLKRTLAALQAQLGGPCPQQLQPALIRMLANYLQSMSEVRFSRFSAAVVVLNFTDTDDLHAKARQGFEPQMRDYLAITSNMNGLMTRMEQPRALIGTGPLDRIIPDSNGMIGYPAEVVYLGQEFPGKDIAILKLDGKGGGAFPVKPVMPGGFEDRLICLPLGNSDDFQMGSEITAMGFPGVAVSLEGLKESASYRVIPQDGSITAAEPLATGWDALHMTAAIDHGHSGGPVVDQDGKVVAINVAGPQSVDGHGLAGYAVAIPINVAKQALAAAGIKADPGPSTKLWEEGLALFDQRQFKEAQGKFRDLKALQQGRGALPFAVDDKGSGVFSAVEEMIVRCQKSQ